MKHRLIFGQAACKNPHVSAPRQNFQKPFGTFLLAKFHLISFKREGGVVKDIWVKSLDFGSSDFV